MYISYLQLEYKNSMPASSYQQQKLRVCEICSAYLGIHDNDRRLADHFGGKLHLGFITIRDKLAELKVGTSFCYIDSIKSSIYKLFCTSLWVGPSLTKLCQTDI